MNRPLAALAQDAKTAKKIKSVLANTAVFFFLGILCVLAVQGFFLYRNFSVEMATRARMMVMIQKRTMIFGSATPFSSKWW